MQTERVNYRVSVNQDDDGSYFAQVLDLPGCFASGETIEELEEGLREALELYLSSADVRATVGGFSLTQERLVDDDHVPVSVGLALA